jgi:hypothetical protein
MHAPIFSPREAQAERLVARHAARKTPLSCGNVPGASRVRRPRRIPGEAYDVGAYRQAIWKACDRAFPPAAELARQRVASAKPGGKRARWETPAEWRARLGPERWAQLEAHRRAHRWHPHRLRHNAATYLRREFGADAAQLILGHRSLAVTEIYAEPDMSKAIDVIQKIG